jgi:hypothetical protein
MSPNEMRNPDPNDNDATIVAGPEARAAADAPADLEAGWREWSSHVQKVDTPGMTLLRAAFEAGWEAAVAKKPEDQR